MSTRRVVVEFSEDSYTYILVIGDDDARVVSSINAVIQESIVSMETMETGAKPRGKLVSLTVSRLLEIFQQELAICVIIVCFADLIRQRGEQASDSRKIERRASSAIRYGTLRIMRIIIRSS
jgi:hypothetical protein